ncbi:MAG TPA: hypothetical protein VFI65_00010 [Streptosporangiaceae bacterium]|nr:hypothetical protein [Streptosporangiaceae bacterium]
MIVSGLVAASGSLGLTTAGSAAAAGSVSAARSAAAATPVITVNGDGGDKTYQGVGAILGGGGNARYLMDYPSAQRNQILDYLFKLGYGASLQILKLEIGGGTNSTDGSEPSIEPSPGNINCNAGWEFSIAQAAVQRNPNIILSGLQWTAPAWVTGQNSAGTATLFTQNDITYLIDWLNCAKSLGLTIGYLGGWNENAGGDTTGASTYQWYVDLHNALAANGFGNVKIIAGDLNPKWEFASNASPNPFPDIDVLGTHDMCHYPNEELTNGNAPVCNPPKDSSGNSFFPPQPLWASELGAMDAGAQTGCNTPCAPAMDRSLVRGYNEARLVGYLEWPAIDAMPVLGSVEDSTPLPYENRGLVTADQPWSGNYSVNAMTWAIAQETDFVTPPTPTDRWVYQDTGTGYLPSTNNTNDGGAYVTLLHQTRATTSEPWQGVGYTTIVETTTATANQNVDFNISGGAGVSGGVASLPVHIWSSNFNFGSQFDEPQFWLWHRGDTTSSSLESGYTLQPGFIYTFTTAATNASTSTSQAPGSASASPPPTPPASASFALPYTDTLATAGAAGSLDDEPQYLDAQDGSFEMVPCASAPPGGFSNCAGQTTVRATVGGTAQPPVFWHPDNSGVRYPYAIIGDGSWTNYTENVNMLLPASSSGGLIGYYTQRADSNNPGLFNGFVFDLSTTGGWKLVSNSTSTSGQTVLDSGTFAWPAGHGGTTWNKLTLSFSEGGVLCGSPVPTTASQLNITAAIDGTTVSTDTVCSTSTAGLGGIEAGYTNSTSENWPTVQYSGLSVTSP